MQQQQRRPRRRARQNQMVPRNNQLTVMKRRFHQHSELGYESWTNLGGSHLRSANKTLSFTAGSLPGWSTISQNWDQYRIVKVSYRFVNDSILGQTALNAQARTVNLLSAFDPDGGTEAAVDILSRNNLKISTLGYGSNQTVTISCTPSYRTTDGEVRRMAWIDQATSTLEFFTFQTVVDTLKYGIDPGFVLDMSVYITVDLEFRGAR